MKKILILVLLILFCSGSAFGGEFEETLKKVEQDDAKSPSEMTVSQAPSAMTPSEKASLPNPTGGTLPPIPQPAPKPIGKLLNNKLTPSGKVFFGGVTGAPPPPPPPPIVGGKVLDNK